jgi:hypothetical protein
MRFPRAAVLSCLTVFLSSCASSYSVVQLPERDADLYPRSQTREGVTIAIDEIRGGQRATRYFGTNLTRRGVLPVTVVVSNYGKERVLVKPSDILVHRGNDIIDPLPIETIIAMAKDERWFLREKTEKQVEKYFEGLVFTESVVMPAETYQGVMFFPAPRAERNTGSLFNVMTLFREGGPRIRVGMRNMDTQDRVLFGPFSLTMPSETSSRDSW